MVPLKTSDALLVPSSLARVCFLSSPGGVEGLVALHCPSALEGVVCCVTVLVFPEPLWVVSVPFSWGT